MPNRHTRASARIASLGIFTVALALSPATLAAPAQPRAPGADPNDKNMVLTADKITRDTVNDTVSAVGSVQIVQGASMLLADRVIYNVSTGVVHATGNVKLVNAQGDIYFGDYLDMTEDMREAFIRNVSALLSDNSRMVGTSAKKEGNATTFKHTVYSPCQLCADDPTVSPTWEIDAERVVHDLDEHKLYYHNATFDLDGIPFLWTPYFSTYDPSVKRADGFLETITGTRSQLGIFAHSQYYFDIAPDIDAILETGYYAEQGPLVGGQYRERFDNGQIVLSGSITESNIRQYPTAQNQDQKEARGHIFGTGEFDISDEWRVGFNLARSWDNIYVLKYGYTSLQVLPTQVYAEGFYDRGYINISAYSFQDLRPNIDYTQPKILPYLSYQFFGDPGDTLGGRWEDSGSVLDVQTFPGQSIQRVANNLDWSRKLISDIGLVTNVDASLETDYYRTENPATDPITNLKPAQGTAGRVFPQAYAVFSYPLVRPLGYGQLIVEPIVSVVVSPSTANNPNIPNEDSQYIGLDVSNLFSPNRFPGIDRIDDGTRATYGVKTSLDNLGVGYASLFLGESYRFTGDSAFPTSSGLRSRFSDYVGEIDINPAKYVDFDYKFEVSNDFKNSRLSEANFRFGTDTVGIYGAYLFSGQTNLPATPALSATERNELSSAVYYKFTDHWTVTGTSTAELTHPRAVLRYGLIAAYSDDCSTISINVTHDQTLPVGGTSGTGVFIQFSLKNLGTFTTPNVH